MLLQTYSTIRPAERAGPKGPYTVPNLFYRAQPYVFISYKLLQCEI